MSPRKKSLCGVVQSLPLKVAMPSGDGGVGMRGVNIDDQEAGIAVLDIASEGFLPNFAGDPALAPGCECVGRELDRAEWNGIAKAATARRKTLSRNTKLKRVRYRR